MLLVLTAAWAVCMQLNHPCVLEHFEQLAQKLHGKRLAVFLDYDGKLCYAASKLKPL